MKSLIGLVMSKSHSVVVLTFLFSFNSLAEISLPLPGVPIDDSVLERRMKESKTNSAFVPGDEFEEVDIKTKKKSVYVPEDTDEAGLDSQVTTREKLKNFGSTVPHSMEGGESYERLSNRDLLYQFQGEGSKSFGFYYIQDTYDVSDANGIYQRTYGDNVSQAMRGGSVHLSYERYWVHNKVFLGWGMNFGVGLSQGKGSFTSSGVATEQSTTKFSLWTLPLDLGLVFEVPLGNWLKIGISGGPSAMGLYQHRDDKDNREGGKHLRQVSYGYYGRANLKISMSHFMPSQAVRNLKAYTMTKMYLTLEARMQEFNNFQDDLSITGQSFGLGFAFEYL